MSKVYFTSDLHFGHRNIGKYRDFIGINSEQENREKICAEWANVIMKRDVVWVLGDCCFEKECITDIVNLPGKKRLVLGNHDIKYIEPYFSAFEQIYGVKRYKNFWLSHVPIHSEELRGQCNIHGHSHCNLWDGYDYAHYINVSCDWLYQNTGSFFIELETIKRRGVV